MTDSYFVAKRKKTTRKYYKLTDTAWTRPNLTTNGTLGGDAFAVASSGYEASAAHSGDIWLAFDASASTYWRGNAKSGWLIFYNPMPLNVTKLIWDFFWSAPTGGDVLGSNDGSTWELIGAYTNTVGSAVVIDLASNIKAFKYYKITATGNTKGSDVLHCPNLQIATERVISVGTEADHDYYEDIVKEDVFIPQRSKGVRKYYKYIEAPFVRPNLTSNGVMGVDEFAVSASEDNNNAWEAVDNTNSYWGKEITSNNNNYPSFEASFYFFTKHQTNILKLGFISTSAGFLYSVFGSNDGVNYTTIPFNQTVGSKGNISGGVFSLTNNTSFYTYYRLSLSSFDYYEFDYEYTLYKSKVFISDLIIEGTTRNAVEGTPSDYDYYEDIKDSPVFIPQRKVI